MSISEDDVTFFRDQGYLLVEDVLDEEMLEQMREVVGRFVDGSREITESNEIYDIGAGHSANHPALRRLKDPHLRHPIFEQLMRSPTILDVVEALIGPGVRFDHSKLNFKPVGGEAAVEWHQDWAFYPHTNDGLLAVGVLLEDCGPDNGPLMVLPGSHRGPTYDHHYGGYFSGAINLDTVELDTSNAVALTGSAGSMTVHHVRTVHGSTENRSSSTRPLLLYSYVALDAWPLTQPTDLAEFDQRILRGKPTLTPRQEALPIRLPFPHKSGADGIFDDQAEIRGRSFAQH